MTNPTLRRYVLHMGAERSADIDADVTITIPAGQTALEAVNDSTTARHIRPTVVVDTTNDPAGFAHSALVTDGPQYPQCRYMFDVAPWFRDQPGVITSAAVRLIQDVDNRSGGQWLAVPYVTDPDTGVVIPAPTPDILEIPLGNSAPHDVISQYWTHNAAGIPWDEYPPESFGVMAWLVERPSQAGNTYTAAAARLNELDLILTQVDAPDIQILSPTVTATAAGFTASWAYDPRSGPAAGYSINVRDINRGTAERDVFAYTSGIVWTPDAAAQALDVLDHGPTYAVEITPHGPPVLGRELVGDPATAIITTPAPTLPAPIINSATVNDTGVVILEIEHAGDSTEIQIGATIAGTVPQPELGPLHAGNVTVRRYLTDRAALGQITNPISTVTFPYAPNAPAVDIFIRYTDGTDWSPTTLVPSLDTSHDRYGITINPAATKIRTHEPRPTVFGAPSAGDYAELSIDATAHRRTNRIPTTVALPAGTATSIIDTDKARPTVHQFSTEADRPTLETIRNAAVIGAGIIIRDPWGNITHARIADSVDATAIPLLDDTGNAAEYYAVNFTAHETADPDA